MSDTMSRSTTSGISPLSSSSTSPVWGQLVGTDPQSQNQQLMAQIASMPKPMNQAVTPLQPFAPPQRPAALGGGGNRGGYTGAYGNIDANNRAVKAAEGFLGVPYQWGGESRGGIDCSGLVQDVFGSLGVKLPRTTYDQVKMGQGVASIQQAQPGDLIFFNGNEHVGIYAGNGMMIDAPHTGTTVGVHRIGGYGPISAIRRVL